MIWYYLIDGLNVKVLLIDLLFISQEDYIVCILSKFFRILLQVSPVAQD